MKSYLFVMPMRRAPSLRLGEAVPAMYEALANVFAPRRFHFTIDDGESRYVARGSSERWDGEEITSEALTRCPPQESANPIAELREALVAAQPTRLWISAVGALRHRAPGTDELAWYGRWRPQRWAGSLIKVSFTWTDDEQCVEVQFPFVGYPLTSIRLLAEPDGDVWLTDGDAAAAAANRALVFDAIGGIPAALGLSREDVTWQIEGDPTVLAARYPEDAAAVEAAVVRLRSGPNESA